MLCMKNYLLKPISVCLIAIALLTSCSKEGVESNDQKGGASAQFTGDEPSKTGSLAGNITPAEADPIVLMHGKVEIKLLVNADGSIEKNSIPAGDYTVQIHANNPEYGDVMINDIRIEAGKTMDLVKIVLVKITSK